MTRQARSGWVTVPTTSESISRLLNARSPDEASDQALRIARRALLETGNNTSILLEGCPLSLAVAASLPKDKPLTVITPSIGVALMLATHPHVEVVLLGGWVETATGTSPQIGHVDLQRHIFVDTALLSVSGVSARRGLSTRHVHEAAFKRSVMQCARRTIALADPTSTGADSLVSFAGLADISMLIVAGDLRDIDASTCKALGHRAVCV